jgi:hypothetical protein
LIVEVEVLRKIGLLFRYNGRPYVIDETSRGGL